MASKIEYMTSEDGQYRTVFINVGTNDLESTNSSDHVMGYMKCRIENTEQVFHKSAIVINSIVRKRDIQPQLIKRANKRIRRLFQDLGVVFRDTAEWIDLCI